jgi:hypothetical protein
MGKALEMLREVDVRYLRNGWKDTRGVPHSPIFEPTGRTDKVIAFSEEHEVGRDYADLAKRFDDLNERADKDLLPKFDALLSKFQLL